MLMLVRFGVWNHMAVDISNTALCTFTEVIPKLQEYHFFGPPCRSFRRRYFNRSDDPTNSVEALKGDKSSR